VVGLCLESHCLLLPPPFLYLSRWWWKKKTTQGTQPQKPTTGPGWTRSFLCPGAWVPVFGLLVSRVLRTTTLCERPTEGEPMAPGRLTAGLDRCTSSSNQRVGDSGRRLMHLVPAPAVRLMKRRVQSRPGARQENRFLSW